MFDVGSIVLIPFPYSDLSATKKRPVLMLTRPDKQGDFIGMPLTSKFQPSPALRLEAGNLSGNGKLPLTSWVKTDTVFSLCLSQIIKAIGQITETERNYCINHLCQYLHKGG